MTYMHITSTDNTKIKQIVRLANSRSYRYEQGLAIIYGSHLVEEALKHGVLYSLFISESALKDYINFLDDVGSAKIYTVSNEVLSKIDVTKSAINMVGLIYIKSSNINDSYYSEDCVILENIQDPGNLGTIMRTCVACGIRNIFLSKSCVDPYNLKVLRASQGIQFKLNIIYLNDLGKFLDNYTGVVIATMPDTKDTIYEYGFTTPCAWVFGNEGYGISDKILNHRSAIHLAIPMPGKSESLNVAMAVAVCLFEMLRQRRFGK